MHTHMMQTSNGESVQGWRCSRHDATAFRKKVPFREIPIDHIHHPLHPHTITRDDDAYSQACNIQYERTEHENQIGAKDFDGYVSTAALGLSVELCILESSPPHGRRHTHIQYNTNDKLSWKAAESDLVFISLTMKTSNKDTYPFFHQR